MLNPPSIRARTCALAALAGLAGACALRAQALQLTVVGGSTPGDLAFDMAPSTAPFQFAAVIPSFSQGPTPLAVFDPNDPRSMQLGTELLSLSWLGLTDLNQRFAVGPLPLGSVPSFQDLPIFFQGVTLSGGVPIVDQISNPGIIRLGIANTFRDRGVTFPDERAFATVVGRADGRWMVVGGARGQLLAQNAHRTTGIYDPFTDTFTLGPQMNDPRSLHTQTTLPDGRTLFVGGVDAFNNPQSSCEIYDPATDSFTLVAPMNSPRMGHTATLLPDGRVFVTGGFDALTVTPTQLSAIFDIVDSTEIYDPATDTWSPAADLSVPRAGHVAILRPNGTVLLAGGVSWYTFIINLTRVEDSCDLFDPGAGTMVAGPTMDATRSLLEPVPLPNDRYLFAGGIGALSLTNLGTPTAASGIYDAVANTWTGIAPLNVARGYHRGWVLDNGDLMLAGGAAGNILTPVPLDSVEIYSVGSGTFALGPPMTIPRAGPARFRTPQGQVQLFGGGTTGNVIVNSSEFYYH